MTSETETDISGTEDPLIPALLMTVAQEVCAAMCASEVVISGLDSQGFRCLASAGEAPRAGACLQHDSRFSADCLKTGEVVFLKDADGDLGTPLSTAGSLPVLAMAVPILAKGSVVGALEIFFTTHSAICAADIAPLKKIVDFLGPILARSGYAQLITDGCTLGAIQTQTSLPTAQGTETGSPPEFTLGHARASENTTEPDQASRNSKGTLISAVAAGFLFLAAGSASYLRITSSPTRSKLTATVSQPRASVVVSQSPPQDGTARRATFLEDVTLASPTVTTAHTNRQSAAASTHPISVSAVLPEYPLIAKDQRLEGDVRLDAVIDVNGRVSATKAISGPVLLQQAAVDALRQWRYRPATLNGKPVPMHLSVTIRFRVRQ